MFVLSSATLGPGKRLLTVGARTVLLERKPYLVFLCLIENRQRMVYREELLQCSGIARKSTIKVSARQSVACAKPWATAKAQTSSRPAGNQVTVMSQLGHSVERGGHGVGKSEAHRREFNAAAAQSDLFEGLA
jgi:hypothetical protein